MPALCGAFEPLHGFCFQGLIVAKDHAGCSTAPAANTFICIDIYGALLVYDRMDSTHGLGKTGFTVMFTDNVQHNDCLLYHVPPAFSPDGEGAGEVKCTQHDIVFL